MIGVALVADTGAAMEAMTRSVAGVACASIVRHCHGHSPVTAAMARFAPELVIVDEMGLPRLALQRIAEISETLPRARIVVRTARPDADWLAEAFRAGASAIVPATAGTETLAVVLAEVIGERKLDVHRNSIAMAA